VNDAPARRPTLRDVAQLAGVSIGTASNVLTGRRVVAPETRRAVEKAVATLDYRPDVSARALISRRARNAPPPPPDRPRLLCVGYLCADHLARVPALPRRGERTVAASVEKMLGGRAANVAVTAAGLGGEIATAVQLLTVTGDDADSDWAAALLAARRVALAPASRQPGARLSRALVLIEHDGERAIVNERLRVGPPALSATLAEMEAEMEAGAASPRRARCFFREISSRRWRRWRATPAPEDGAPRSSSARRTRRSGAAGCAR
jgi:transcriptional regulator with XRE-family HTH domain